MTSDHPTAGPVARTLAGLLRLAWPTGVYLIPCLLSALAVVMITGLSRAAPPPQVVDVQLSAGERETTVRFIVDQPIDFRIFTLASPLRLVVDMPAVDWRSPPAQLTRVARQSGGVRDVRRGNFRTGTLRIVLDLEAPIAVDSAALVPHGRQYALTVRWRQIRNYKSQRFGDFQAVPLPPPRPAGGESRPAPLVVLDPGHGGVDPGASGRRGTQEKAVTLAMAKRLATALKATGRYRVVLTRNDDRFLPLRERTRIARRHGANLFLSLHADSALRSEARGLSVYTLSDQASDEEAGALAKRENKADVLGGLNLTDEQPDVVSILIDLAQRETKNRSVRFANQLVQTMVLRVPLLDRPHRQAGFAVLKAPDIPAALIELGFLSHPEEERLLLSGKHRSAIIEGIVAATDNFFVERWGSKTAADR